ncbi:ArsR/SmtB family transcription factor [Paraglaciecola polaris]|uniref:ArsR family transcriptional regulator n=1 Tax=Paraglaciecola polaris LMG 21857 TaxID=1129793 RepID=K7A0Q2_9ALTE|nr:helix-turn-helix domain-containing protein [Paraglaciecola polaris]GAC34543.1 ArsR family transcriptional regulator [Paraglaciecola polaris LMG 21857]|tara:strand:+ start:1625 stop:1945 length:321 start_codon:yes stop_codon:yes gene_type:complete
MIEADIYKALGDPVRLEIIRRLANGSSNTITELSKNLGVSRQGARKQLQVLVSANLVRLLPKGRETAVTLDTTKLKVAGLFIAKLEAQWDLRLHALKKLVQDDPTS